MSRFSDYDDDGEHQITYEMYMHNVNATIAGKKGQTKLREFKAALEAVPSQRLVDEWIADLNGDVCAIGAFAAYKRMQRTGQTWAEVTADLNQGFHPVQTPLLLRDGRYLEGACEPVYADAIETQELGIRECGLNRTLAWHLVYLNDEGAFVAATPEERWQKAYVWVCDKLGEPVS